MRGLSIILFCFANVAFASAKTNSLEYIVRSGIVDEKGEAQLCVMATLIRRDGYPRGRSSRERGMPDARCSSSAPFSS